MVTSYLDAISDALREEMERDETIFHMGTRQHADLLPIFGERRVLKMPIAEATMVGMAVGAAASGLRPVLDLVNVTFSFVAMDHIANQAARMRYMFGGQYALPIVIRAGYFHGTSAAAQHSITGYAVFAQIGGIHIVVPSTTREAKGLLKTALRGSNPVFMFEAGRVVEVPDEIPDDDDAIPFGVANIVRPGEDVTVVGIGFMVHEALRAAEELDREGVSVEVIDPRTLVPLDLDTIRESVRRTGRLVVADESFPTASMASEIITAVLEDAETFDTLRGPAVRLCTEPVPIPYSGPLEAEVLPRADDIMSAVRTLLASSKVVPAGRETVSTARG